MKIIAYLPIKESLKQSLRASEDRSIMINNRRFCVATMKTFAVHGCTCVRCGIQGNTIVAWEDNGGGLHVDLFAKLGSNLYLMNRDHIIPKSKKGPNTDWNYQPMCAKCNTKKGNAETPEDRQLAAFRQHWKKIHCAIHDNVFKWMPKWMKGSNLKKKIVKFRESYLHHFTYVLAKVTA